MVQGVRERQRDVGRVSQEQQESLNRRDHAEGPSVVPASGPQHSMPDNPRGANSGGRPTPADVPHWGARETT